jgi:hypothetical protein
MLQEQKILAVLTSAKMYLSILNSMPGQTQHFTYTAPKTWHDEKVKMSHSFLSLQSIQH